MKVVLASHNAGKIREFTALLKPFALEVIPQADLGVSDVEETGLTFIENALIKARHAAQMTGLPAISDDSGLVVSALNGAPGIYSARYAGNKANSTDNITKLLQDLKDVPPAKRGAYFNCVLVFMQHALDPTPIVCSAQWHGSILTSTRGQEGFGYDPIFYYAPDDKTAAELPLEIKNKISHRGKAIQLLLNELSEKLNRESLT